MQQSGKNTSTSAAEIMRFTSKASRELLKAKHTRFLSKKFLDPTYVRETCLLRFHSSFNKAPWMAITKVCIFAYGQINAEQQVQGVLNLIDLSYVWFHAARQLFELRAHNLVRYVVDTLGTNIGQEDIKPALEAAFQRMDDEVPKEMRALRESIDSWKEFEVFQHTKINNMVVLVHNGWVLYTAGAANARVAMSRSFKPDDNAPSADNRNAAKNTSCTISTRNAYRRTSARFGPYMDPS
ncbi:hypothetical protein SELMODRAFT_412088 [Selaginella moellendorffii]|uniref:Uncharacterized protein n=1 Tax=Selaginella moellendorffii TaxID=88036 RepID=D8RK07_SELML|nr:hypothetical protein SELMODRAFT_412088 [Selaginella moellendorffii]